MNGYLKIDIAAVNSQGQTIITAAKNIGTALETLKDLVGQLGSYWQDSIYAQAASEMNSNISNLLPMQEELVNLGNEIVSIASQYAANKEQVKGMFQ